MSKRDIERGKVLGCLELIDELMLWDPAEHSRGCECDACGAILKVTAAMATRLTLAGVLPPPDMIDMGRAFGPGE